MNVKIGCISDTHNKHKQIEIEDCDILLCAGDFTGRGYKHESESFINWFKKQPGTYKVFIAGNHEIGWDEKEYNSWIQEMLDEELDENTIYLEDSWTEIMGLKIYGTPWQPRFYDWAFNLDRGKLLAEKWSMIPADTNILITHGPPYGVDDYIPWEWVKSHESDNLLGCKDLLNRVKQLRQLKLHVFGHIHLDDRKKIEPRTIPGSDAQYVNASVLNNKYELKYKPYYTTYEI